MTEYTTEYVTGRVYWAKIVGKKALHDNYDATHGGEKPGREWSYELVPDDVDFLKKHKLLDRLKDKDDAQNPDKGDYLFLKKPEFNKDGDLNDPVTILDSENEPWDNKLLGNGTKVTAKLTIADFGRGKKKAIWTDALRIEELVPFESEGRSSGFGDYDAAQGKSKPKTKTSKAKSGLDDLDDDMPF